MLNNQNQSKMEWPRKILIKNEAGFEKFSYDAQVCWDTKPKKPESFPCVVVAHKEVTEMHDMGCQTVYEDYVLTYVYLKDFE